MPSKRERILNALFALLAPIAADFSPSPLIQRNGDLPQKIGPEGLIVLRDGNAGDAPAEYCIGAPEPYTWDFKPLLEIAVQDAGPAERDPQFDALVTAVSAVVMANRTLGGLCDWLDAVLPDAADKPIANAPGIKGATIPLSISYSSASPLG